MGIQPRDPRWKCAKTEPAQEMRALSYDLDAAATELARLSSEIGTLHWQLTPRGSQHIEQPTENQGKAIRKLEEAKDELSTAVDFAHKAKRAMNLAAQWME